MSFLFSTHASGGEGVFSNCNPRTTNHQREKGGQREREWRVEGRQRLAAGHRRTWCDLLALPPRKTQKESEGEREGEGRTGDRGGRAVTHRRKVVLVTLCEPPFTTPHPNSHLPPLVEPSTPQILYAWPKNELERSEGQRIQR